jgi:hypothetical protein
MSRPIRFAPDGRLWDDVRFSLTYDGPLLSASEKNTRVRHKNEIRAYLYGQLLPLSMLLDFGRFGMDQSKVASEYHDHHGIHFYPIVSRVLEASCSLTIKLMRSERPGDIVHGGDLDNRLKTLLDALRMPTNDSEVIPEVYSETAMRGSTSPMIICLLEDDSLVTDLNISTVRSFHFTKPPDQHEVRLIIDVELRPFDFCG